MTGISKAVEAAGGVRLLAEKLGVTRQAVFKWHQRGWVPLARALEIERVYGVPRQQLVKPDIAILMAD